MNFRGTKFALTALAATATAVVGAAVPASAAVGSPGTPTTATSSPTTLDARCSNNYVCMWEDPDYSGGRYVNQYKRSGYYQIDGWDGDNEISSVKNYTGKCVRLYANDDFNGDSYTIDKAVRHISNLEQVGFDNEAESYRIFSC